MPMADPPSGSGRYIIRSEDSSTLADIIKTVNSDPGITLVDTIGPADQPHTAVVEMPHDKARFLEQQFRNAKGKIIIEPDRPLSLFEGVRGGQA